MIFWAGRSSDDVRLIVEYYPAQSRPAKKVEMLSVPGRSGDLIFEQDAYENYVQPYDIYISAEHIKLPRAAKEAAAWLLAPRGYQKLEDTYDLDTYRMAYFMGPVEIENIMNRFGRATIEFNCKPQRYLKTGDIPITFTESGTIVNPTLFDALPIITVYGSGSGTVSVGGTAVSIREIDEYVTLDCDTQNAYKGTLNKNLTISAPTFPKLGTGENAIGFTGGITRVDIIPRWWTI